MNIERDQGLLVWQWSIYRDGHRDRYNLVVHALTVPLFIVGSLVLSSALLMRAWGLAAVGLGAMVVAMALQGRAHKREHTPPAPFRGPWDFLARVFAEQWVTFPRFVLTGEFGRAWCLE